MYSNIYGLIIQFFSSFDFSLIDIKTANIRSVLKRDGSNK